MQYNVLNCGFMAQEPYIDILRSEHQTYTNQTVMANPFQNLILLYQIFRHLRVLLN